MNSNLWAFQIWTIMKMELKRNILARRWVGVYLAAFAPVLLLILVATRSRGAESISGMSLDYAGFYRMYVLRLAIFFSSALVFSQLFRGEVLEKTLHFYLLAPVRRDVIAAGKYLSGVVGMSVIFGTSTILTHILVHVQSSAWKTFFFEGEGFSHTFLYVVATVMACSAYGGIFMLAGLLFKNPVGPAIGMGAWEVFYFILPESLQKFTVMHYVQSVLPVKMDLGVFAVMIDPTPAIIGIPILAVVVLFLVWLSGQVLRRTQVTYSAD